MPATHDVPEAMRETYEWLCHATDDVCAHHLNKEYAVLARQMAAALARKRPSPLARGSHEGWACGILYALGRVNFMFDQTQTPCLSAEQLCSIFRVSASTGAAKAKRIEQLLRIRVMDPKWSLPSRLADNPIAWLIEFNGVVLDARALPKELQEIAYRKGLIPYVP
ncbi:MAG: DUF6398 domain-containing protein [Thermoanaerobaculia bacterium]